MTSKLVSCLGFATRLARSVAAPREVSDHLQQALYFLKAHVADSTQCAERDPKRRKVICLSDALMRETLKTHSSCQTYGQVVDASRLQDLHALVAEMGKRNQEMVNLQIQRHCADMDELMERREAALSQQLQDRDRQIAMLGQRFNTNGAAPTNPDLLNSRCSSADEDSSALSLLTEPDLARLSCSSRFHFERFHGMLVEENQSMCIRMPMIAKKATMTGGICGPTSISAIAPRPGAQALPCDHEGDAGDPTRAHPNCSSCASSGDAHRAWAGPDPPGMAKHRGFLWWKVVGWRGGVNDPVQDPPRVIKVPVSGAPQVVKRIVHEEQLVPVPVKSPPQYHTIPVPVPVTDPGRLSANSARLAFV
eukprot:Skav231742  [mRNA]  locus=scaffold638:255767:259287:- [translate_table: standard]